MPSAALFFVLILGVVVAVVTSEQDMKRSFSGLGCMGVYDKAKFARLDRVCEECYQLFRESDVHTLCRSNCFKNNFFTQCGCPAAPERSAAIGHHGGRTVWQAVNGSMLHGGDNFLECEALVSYVTY
ncbi:ion transport peptide-like [Caerostris extrusa]|uniref:Ion transport peptide-like n=1 Tax=Caerostris extrusa TaxID=172846 RepID=A0AAV4R4N3_CAEEX|nr:ion transport peptide-like [Caerostris extrusa]